MEIRVGKEKLNSLYESAKKCVNSFFMCIEMRWRRKQAEILRFREYGLVKTNIKYKNIHNGKRCFIIGNGPSLKTVDLAKLKDEITFTVNQSPRMKDFPKIHTNYHIWTDERFFNEDFSSPEGKELLEVMKSVNTDGNKPTVFYKTSAVKMIKEQELEKELDISYVMEGFSLKSPDLDLPIDRVITGFPTCVHYLILVAVYMGFSEIYLLGCDCTFILNIINARLEASEKMEYAYECSTNELNRICKQQKTALEWELKNFAALFRAYRTLNMYCEHHGVKLYNATRGSLLEGIEKVRIEDVLKEV